MKVKEKMTTSVTFANPNTTVIETAQLMQKHNIGAVPICDQNNLVGIVTDRDIVVRNVAHGTNATTTTAKDVMTSKVMTVTPETDLNEVSNLMATEQIRRVPVVDNNKLVGIISLGDISVLSQFDTEASEALSEISKPTKPGNF